MADPSAWPREEEEYLMKVADQCQFLSIQYNEIYNTYRVHETRFKLPGIVLGSFVGMLSFGASQFGPYTQMITIGVGCSSIVISVISSIEAYLKIGETMTNSLATTTAFKRLKEKIDLELRMNPVERTQNSTLFLRQCYQEYMDIVERAPPLYFRGILSRLRSQFIKRTPKTNTGTIGGIANPPVAPRFQNLVNSIFAFKQTGGGAPQPRNSLSVENTNNTPQINRSPTAEVLSSSPIQNKLKAWAGRAKLNTAPTSSAEPNV
jgi:hypothetical protein